MTDDVGAVERGVEAVAVSDIDVVDRDVADLAHVAEVEVVERPDRPLRVMLLEQLYDAAPGVARRARDRDCWRVFVIGHVDVYVGRLCIGPVNFASGGVSVGWRCYDGMKDRPINILPTERG